jgi:hypothetical protein
MAFIGFITKQPAEELPISISYLLALDGRTGTVGVPMVTVPAGMTIRDPVLNGTTFSFIVEGGEDGSAYDFEIDAVLTIGGVPETVQDEITVIVREAVAAERMTDLSEALPLVLPFAQHCPEDVALFNLRQAAMDFFHRTLAWRATLNVTAKEGVGSYYFPTPPQSLVVKLLDAYVGDVQVPVVKMETGRKAAMLTYQDAIWTDDRETFHVRPVPGTQGIEQPITLSLSVALKPTQTATAIPTTQFNHHADAIANGALTRLLLQRGRAWGDPQAAARHSQVYEGAIGDLLALSARGHARAPFGVAPHWF